MPSCSSWVGALAVGVGLLTSNGCGDARSARIGDSGAPDAVSADARRPDADASRPVADAMGGDTGEAGASGDGGVNNSCVSVTGGGGEPWLDLQITGAQFDAYEGRRIRVVVSSSVGGRLGVAEATIVGGAFDFKIPGTFNYGARTEIDLFVDDDGNSTCDVGEPLWGFVTGIVSDNLMVTATPARPCLSGGGTSMIQGCTSWLTPPGACFINGQADLQMRLPCPP